MSRDVAEKMVPYCFHTKGYQMEDDRMIGYVLDEHNIAVTNGTRFNVPPAREDVMDVFGDYILNAIPPCTYHIRTRCGDDSFRERNNVKIYRRLVDTFYPSLGEN